MKTEEAYTKIMNQLEVIHAENTFLMEAMLIHSGIPKEEAGDYAKEWDMRFQEERKKW